MKFLLDTHVFIWFIRGDDRLSPRVLDVLRNPEDEFLVSVVSMWEAIVKARLGKLVLPTPYGPFLTDQREKHLLSSLPLDESSLVPLDTLPHIHRDPFDRMLLCQAIHHDLTLITVDKVLARYPVRVLLGS